MPPFRSDISGSSQQDVLWCGSPSWTHRAHRSPHGNLTGLCFSGSHVNALLPFLKGAVPRLRPHACTALHLRPCRVHQLLLGGWWRQLSPQCRWHPLTLWHPKKHRGRSWNFSLPSLFVSLFWCAAWLWTNKLCIKMRLNIYHYECLSQRFVKIRLIDITNNNERKAGGRGCTRWCQSCVCWEALFYHNNSVVNVLNLYFDVQWCHFDKRIGWRIFDVLVRREAACLFFTYMVLM